MGEELRKREAEVTEDEKNQAVFLGELLEARDTMFNDGEEVEEISNLIDIFAVE